jgi:membrane protein
LKISFRSVARVFKNAFTCWFKKDPFKEGAVIAYYSIFSLPGLLVLIITLAGYFFGREAVSGQITSQIEGTMGADTAKQVNEIVLKASAAKNSVLAGIIGVITILLGATGVLAQFQKSLNIIWEVKADPKKSGLWTMIKVRLFSFGLILSIAFILIISLVVSTLLASLGKWATSNISESFIVIIQVLNIVFSLAVLTLLFALMFKYFPDAKVKWRHVWKGSMVTALLFELGKFLLGLYFGKAEPGTGYGAAGSIILIMLWVNYSSMIVLFGAEFTRAYAYERDGNVMPEETAVRAKGRQR